MLCIQYHEVHNKRLFLHFLFLGGYKLELFDAEGHFQQSLTPKDGGSKSNGWIDDDTTAQRHLIQIPEGMECSKCTIRLLRQALEWGGNYQFWSCADVDIVPMKGLTDKQLCSSNGLYNDQLGTCQCDQHYYGMQCQYQNECTEDSECQNGGKCVDIQSTTAPTKICFCALGFFGKYCENKSVLDKPLKLVDNGYNKANYKGVIDLYWKVIEESNELEMVMQAKTENYVAVGFKPAGIDASCQAFPDLGNKVEKFQRPYQEGKGRYC